MGIDDPTDAGALGSLVLDVDAAVAVLSCRETGLRAYALAGGLDPATDFTGLDLQGWALADQDLSGFNLAGCNLMGTGIESARIDELTDFTGARMDADATIRFQADKVSRVIMLLYGKMDHGGPFWCYVAVKPTKFESFKAAEARGEIDLYNFDAFGEVVVSAEGDYPPEEVTKKVAELYGADAAKFFQPIDPIAEIAGRISELVREPD